MAMKNEEVIRLLKSENFSKLDPALRTTVIERSVKALRENELYKTTDKARETVKNENGKMFEEFYYLRNRFSAMTKFAKKDTADEFWRNIVTVMCDIDEQDIRVEASEVTISKILENMLYAMKAICRADTGGFACPMCKIEECPMRSSYTQEEVEKMMEKQLKEMESKKENTEKQGMMDIPKEEVNPELAEACDKAAEEMDESKTSVACNHFGDDDKLLLTAEFANLSSGYPVKCARCDKVFNNDKEVLNELKYIAEAGMLPEGVDTNMETLLSEYGIIAKNKKSWRFWKKD